jgi:hypothetical protein
MATQEPIDLYPEGKVVLPILADSADTCTCGCGCSCCAS